MTVKAILATKGHSVQTMEPAATLAEAMHVLDARNIGAVVVVDPRGRVVGMLSERDIIRRLAEFGPAAFGRTVEQTMTRRVVTCDETATVGDLMEQMTNGKFRHVPVVRDDGRLVGIVSIG
ncbi:MAG: CBS domain-containing protein, partial [Rhizobiales bacterium]|nr:CBS domain-containing protein [Hyphomicrobiales bacterium]